MALSLAIIEGALEQRTKDGYKVSVVIVDKGGNVAASVRGDGTGPHTLEFARPVCANAGLAKVETALK
jgi:uncharacterized protein GlcG (DUF336 family)